MKEEDYLFAFSLIPGIGYKRLKAILSHFGTLETAWKEFRKGSVFIPGIGKGLIDEIQSKTLKINIEKELDNIYKKGIKLITLNSPDYPLLLKKISSPPIVLYMYGELPEGNYISVVGTRKPSHYGLLMTERLSEGIARHGGIVISGMARGIDTRAHIAAIKAGGKSVAVLGTGVDVVYPPENKRIYREIIENGAVISEYPPGTGPKREHFPKRNRIIAGISLGTVVVEAPEKSGALITADFAIEEGREVFAVPGRVDSGKFTGTNRLIKQGAKLVEDVSDIMEEFPYVRWNLHSFHKETPELSEKEKKVYGVLDENPKYIEEIRVESGLSQVELFSVILQLELKGLIREIGGKRYCRIK